MSRPRTRLAQAAFWTAMGGPRARTEPTSDLPAAIAGRVVLVTGASSGIGREVALQCGQAGATVAIVARRADQLETVAAKIRRTGGAATAHTADLSDLDVVDAVAEEVVSTHGRVDVLVNNAARSIRRPVAQSLDRFHDVERTIQLNYLAAVRLVHRVLPGMLDAGDGHIINCLTLGVLATPPRFAAYLGSKSALDAYCRSMAMELGDAGIHVTSAYLPLVRTEMISPTGAYANAPALSPAQAASMITSAMVDRPRRLTPPAGYAIDALRVVAPTSMITAGRRIQRRLSSRNDGRRHG